MERVSRRTEASGPAEFLHHHVLERGYLERGVQTFLVPHYRVMHCQGKSQDGG